VEYVKRHGIDLGRRVHLRSQEIVGVASEARYPKMHPGVEQFTSRSTPSGAQVCSIASVTVAYNGAGVLRRHLGSLQQQSRKLDEIVVVDNASDDDTQHLLVAEYPDVTVLRLPENGGVGGGLAAGLAYAALEKKHDWVWMFDQDSVPSPDALERLLSGLQHLDAAECPAILAPVCVHPQTGMTYPALSWQGWRFVRSAVRPEQPVTFVDMVISSGSLVRKEAIAEAGLPRKDFFMDFVDYEHCLRLRRHGFRIAVVRDSILEHAIGSPSTFTILGRKKSWADHAPWREYYMTRNEIFTIWHYHPQLATKGFVLHRIAHHALGILLFGKRKLDCFGMIWRGFVDGRAGRLGIRFLPGTAPLDSTSRPGGLLVKEISGRGES
jgi:GT2 family glycosyltransferase